MATAYEDYKLSLGPLAWWRWSETSGSTAADEMGSYPLTLSGAHTLGLDGAIVAESNPAIQFDGSTGYASNAGLADALELTANLSFETWGYEDGSNFFTVGFGRVEGSRCNFHTEGGSVYCQVEDDSSSYPNASLPALSGWHHLVMTYDGNESEDDRVLFYVDGEAIALSPAGAGTPSLTTTAAALGDFEVDRAAAYSRYGGGGYDETAVYDYTLTPSQVTGLYQAGLAPPAPAGSLLLARRRLMRGAS